MDISWINREDESQEKWAKRYLLKKKSELTASEQGCFITSYWDADSSALRFLEVLVSEEFSSLVSGSHEKYPPDNEFQLMMLRESASSLLKLMREAWNQCVISSQSPQKKSVKLSMKNFNWLKKYAAKNRKTHVLALDEILQNVQNEVKNAKSESTKIVNDLKMKIEELEATSDKLREQIDSLTKENEQLVRNNLTE